MVRPLSLSDYSAAISRGATSDLLRGRAYVYKLQRRYREAKQDLQAAQKLTDDAMTRAELADIDRLSSLVGNPDPAAIAVTSRLYVSVSSPDQTTDARLFQSTIQFPSLKVDEVTVRKAIPDRTQLAMPMARTRMRESGSPRDCDSSARRWMGPVKVTGARTDRPGHFELWLASTAVIPGAAKTLSEGWWYQESASQSTIKWGLKEGFGAYCHAGRDGCENASAGSRTASQCVFVEKLNEDVWGGAQPQSGGFRGSWYRQNLPRALPGPFPQPPASYKQSQQ